MNATTSEVRHYTRRDSATSALRKLGIDKKDYPKFITKLEDGTIECRIKDAEKFVSKPSAKKSPPKKKKASPKKNRRKPQNAKTSSTTDTRGNINVTVEIKSNQLGSPDSIAGASRRLILQGLSNSEIYEVLKEKFGEEKMPERKRHYPAWFRSEMFRRGMIPAELRGMGRDTERPEVSVEWVDVMEH